MSEVTDDAPAQPKKRMSQKYPGLVQLSWEESERLVRQAESGRNPARVAYARGQRSALERRVQSIGEYKPFRKPGWIHVIPPHKPKHGADWGVILGLSVLLGGAILLLVFLGTMNG